MVEFFLLMLGGLCFVLAFFPRPVQRVQSVFVDNRPHEEKILSIVGYDFDADYVNPPKSRRFVKQEDGSVYSLYGRYYFSKDLWDRWMREERWPDAHHDFAPTSRPVETDVDDTGRVWPSRGMLCSRCGEHRDKVSLFVDTNRINRDGWCIKT